MDSGCLPASFLWVVRSQEFCPKPGASFLQEPDLVGEHPDRHPILRGHWDHPSSRSPPHGAIPQAPAPLGPLQLMAFPWLRPSLRQQTKGGSPGERETPVPWAGLGEARLRPPPRCRLLPPSQPPSSRHSPSGAWGVRELPTGVHGQTFALSISPVVYVSGEPHKQVVR